MTDTSDPPAAPPRRTPPRSSPIVPNDALTGRALIAIVAIMTFLTSLTTGAVMLLRASAGEWQAEVAREVTIQLRPAPGRDLDAAVVKAAAIARDAPGVASVRPYTREESARLLEPWLGSGLSLEELPVPRMIVVKLAPGAEPDLAQLRKTLSEQIAGASLDDHRGFIERMRAMAVSAVVAGAAVLALMLAATVLAVMFATRAVMAANRPVIEVLHFIGARDNYIAGHFQRHFLALGLKGGALGGGVAILLFAVASLFGGGSGSAAGEQMAALFGGFSIGLSGYAALAVQIAVIAAVTALASRRTVSRTLDAVD